MLIDCIIVSNSSLRWILHEFPSIFNCFEIIKSNYQIHELFNEILQLFSANYDQAWLFKFLHQI